MQSIYRFREAEVGLFLRAWNTGVARLPLQRLQLARNFRSHKQLIEWANSAFARVLPGESDIASGSVAFEPSVADQTQDAAELEPAAFHALIDGSPVDEADCVVNLVRRIQANDPAGIHRTAGACANTPGADCAGAARSRPAVYCGRT